MVADPPATMSGDTDLGFNFVWNFDAAKGSYEYNVVGIYGGKYSFEPMVDLGRTIPIVAVDIYSNSFALDFQAKDLAFFA